MQKISTSLFSELCSLPLKWEGYKNGNAAAPVDRLFGTLELDNSYTNKKLCFVPPFSTKQGVQEMVNWYKANKHKKS